MPHPRFVYNWIEITIDKRGRDKRRTLPYRMSAEDIADKAAANPGVRYERVPGSEEACRTEPYVGWGQAGLGKDDKMK